MGTTKSGRYMNTKGSGRSVSDFALVHSNEGTFKWTLLRGQKKNGKQAYQIRLASGGHGQKGMDLLDKYGIEYHVTKTYENGVRVGDVPNHAEPKKRRDSKQSWFPQDWTEKDIRRAGEHVAGLEKNSDAADGKAVFGVYKGVRVGIIKTNGKIATVFPDIDQSSVLKRS